MRRMKERTGRVLLACLLSSIMPLTAADNPPPQPSEIEQLKQMLAEQQKQINELRKALAQQGSQQQANAATPAAAPALPAVDPTPISTFRSLGQVASTTGLLPPSAKVPVAMAIPAIPLPQAAPPDATSSSTNPCEADPGRTVPTFLRLGNVCIVPVGFMDLTPFWRDKNAASSMGSNFGSIPFNNVPNGNLSELHFSEQNSRLGFRIDGDWKGTHFIGYNEFDFNGTSGVDKSRYFKRRDRSAPPPVLGERPQRQGRVPRRPELEHANAQPEWHFRLARRFVLLPSHRHQLRRGPYLDAPTRPTCSGTP